MMPRFYFNVIAAAGRIRDVEGSDLADIDSAQAEAIKDARALMSGAVLQGKDISTRSIEICDEAGEVMRVISFKTAISPFG